MNKVYITWQQVFDRLKTIDHPNAVVYGVPKGGMIAAGFLKKATITHDPSEATIIIDDIYDSGKTVEEYIKKYPETQIFCLFHKEQEFGTDWVVFPWEAEHPAGEESIHQNIVRILQHIGEDPNRIGLQGTPDRVVRMYEEIFRGYNPEKCPKVAVFPNGQDGVQYDQMITDTGIFYSHCEHHMVPFFGTYHFAYIPHPDGNIIGLSKVARIVDYYAARLQIQERLVNDIVEHIWEILSTGTEPPLGMALVMKGEHLCKSMRGVKKKGEMTTTKLKGVFLEDNAVRQEFFNTIKSCIYT